MMNRFARIEMNRELEARKGHKKESSKDGKDGKEGKDDISALPDNGAWA